MISLLRDCVLKNWFALSPDPNASHELAFLIHATGVSKLVCYIFAGESTPRWVAKVPRSPDDNTFLALEYKLVQYLRDRGSDYVRSTVPAPLVVTTLAGHLIVIEPYFPGQSMESLLFSLKDANKPAYQTYLDLIVGWLFRSQLETGNQFRVLTQSQIEVHFFTPIKKFKATAQLMKPELKYLDHLTLRVVELAQEPLPLVFCHGDLRPGNVLIKGDSLLVIDWEFGTKRALPLMDLFGLLARTYACMHFLPEIDGYLEDDIEAFEQVFFENGQFASITLDYVRHACQAFHLNPAWVSILFGMFLITEANRYYSFLNHRSERGYLYLLNYRNGQHSSSFTQQLTRQKHVWLFGYLAEHEDSLILNHLSTTIR